jgi:hypothetical protein
LRLQQRLDGRGDVGEIAGALLLPLKKPMSEKWQLATAELI